MMNLFENYTVDIAVIDGDVCLVVEGNEVFHIASVDTLANEPQDLQEVLENINSNMKYSDNNIVVD